MLKILPANAGDTGLSPGPGTKISHAVQHSQKEKKKKSFSIIQNMFFTQNGTKLEIHNREKSGKTSNIWKVNNTILNNPGGQRRNHKGNLK